MAYKTIFKTDSGEIVYKSILKDPIHTATKAMKRAAQREFDTLGAYDHTGVKLGDYTGLLRRDFMKLKEAI